MVRYWFISVLMFWVGAFIGAWSEQATSIGGTDAHRKDQIMTAIMIVTGLTLISIFVVGLVEVFRH